MPTNIRKAVNTRLKVWDDWSAGIGYPVDDGENPGVYMNVGMIGTKGELRPAQHKFSTSHSSVNANTDLVMHYFFEDRKAATDEGYFYALMRRIGAASVVNIKFDMRNGTFGAVVEQGDSDVDDDWSTPARYKGRWYYWADAGSGHELTTINTAGTPDVFTTSGSVLQGHVAVGSNQLAAESGSGIRLLKPDGAAFTAADYGSAFAVGTSGTTALLTLFSLQSSWHLALADGLYSFDDRGNVGVVMNDYNAFRAVYNNLNVAFWKTGVVIPHPSGLWFYKAGEDPLLIGPDTRLRATTTVRQGPDELTTGLWHSCSAIGDYLYAIYQPIMGSTAAYLMAGTGDPRRGVDGMVWNIIASFTLKESTSRISGHAIATTTLGRPESSTRTSGVLFFTDTDGGSTHLSYMILEGNGRPMRSRTNTHRVNTSGTTFLSELVFPMPVNMEELIVYTQNMIDGDEFRFRMYVDDEDYSGLAYDLGSRVVKNGRTIIKLNRKYVHRAMLVITWAGTSTASRAAPSINRIELWGRQAELSDTGA